MVELDSSVGNVTTDTASESAPEAGALTEEQSAFLILMANILNSISMFACLLVISSFIAGRYFNKKLVSRVSLQLTFAIVVAEFLYSIAQIWSNVYANDDIWCSLSVLGYLAFALLSTFLNLSIGINLQIVFVFNRRYENLSYWYLGLSTVLAFAFTVPPAFLGLYGYESTEATCWYTNPESTESLIWKWASFYGPTCLAILYASFLTVQVWYKLFTTRRTVQLTAGHSHRGGGATNNSSLSNSAIESGGGGAGSSSAVLQASSSGKQESTIKTIQISRSVPRQTTDDVLRQLASRIIFYPLIPLIGQLFNIIADVYTYQTHKQSFEILLISYIGTSIQGTLTAIVFFAIDPAWRKIRHEIVSQHPALGGVLYFWWCGRSRKEAVKKQTASVGTSSKSGVTAPWSGADSPAASLSGTKTTSGGVFDGSLGNGAAIGLEGGGNPRTINVIMNTIDLDNQLESLLNAAASTKPELTPSEKVDKLMPVPISTARTAISPSTPSPSSQYSSSSGPPPSTPPTPTAKLIKSPSSSNKLSPTVSTVSPPPRTHSKSPRTRRVDLM